MMRSDFTPKLKKAYQDIRAANKSFEIVCVYKGKPASDADNEVPWLRLPFDTPPLSRTFQITGYPTLILLDGTSGDTITTEGCNVLLQDAAGAQFPWTRPTALGARGSAKPVNL